MRAPRQRINNLSGKRVPSGAMLFISVSFHPRSRERPNAFRRGTLENGRPVDRDRSTARTRATRRFVSNVRAVFDFSLPRTARIDFHRDDREHIFRVSSWRREECRTRVRFKDDFWRDQPRASSSRTSRGIERRIRSRRSTDARLRIADDQRAISRGGISSGYSFVRSCSKVKSVPSVPNR